MSIKGIDDFHALHAPCTPGRCACRCGCERVIGCTAFSDYCSSCHVGAVRGDWQHGDRDVPWYRALIAAVKVIRQSRIDGHPDKAAMAEAWARYWRTAPEMAAIRAALPGVDLDNVEQL